LDPATDFPEHAEKKILFHTKMNAHFSDYKLSKEDPAVLK